MSPLRFVTRSGIIAALLTLVVAVAAAENDERISVFLIGGTYPPGNPFMGYAMQDPLLSYGVEPIPPDLPDGDKRKLDRIYYPRTRQILIESYRMIVFNDARLQHFTPQQLHDLDYAFREAGMSSMSTFGPAWEQVWEVTTLYDTSPALDYTDQWFHGTFWVKFRRERDEIFTPFIQLGMERMLGDAYHLMTEKPGAVVWADMMPMQRPWMISWRPGGSRAGLQWVCTDGFNALWWGLTGYAYTPGTYGVEGSNPYAIDMAINLILYSVERPLISDIQQRREARHLLSAFRAEKLLILHIMDWADIFGANTGPIAEGLSVVETDAEEATGHFLKQDYPTAISLMQDTSSKISAITREAMRLKDEAMFWVYVSEWLAIMSVSVVAGVALWSLMIWRRTYRAVETTRLTSA